MADVEQSPLPPPEPPEMRTVGSGGGGGGDGLMTLFSVTPDYVFFTGVISRELIESSDYGENRSGQLFLELAHKLPSLPDDQLQECSLDLTLNLDKQATVRVNLNHDARSCVRDILHHLASHIDSGQ